MNVVIVLKIPENAFMDESNPLIYGTFLLNLSSKKLLFYKG